MVVYGGIETGGTKFICIAGTDPDHILAEKRIAQPPLMKQFKRSSIFLSLIQPQRNCPRWVLPLLDRWTLI